MVRKILYSPGFGAGWSSWMNEVPKSFACEYQPIVAALERGEKLTPKHPAVVQFVAECEEKFDTTPYLGGLKDLRICEVPDGTAVRIDEYDGNESVITGYSDFF